MFSLTMGNNLTMSVKYYLDFHQIWGRLSSGFADQTFQCIKNFDFEVVSSQHFGLLKLLLKKFASYCKHVLKQQIGESIGQKKLTN